MEWDQCAARDIAKGRSCCEEVGKATINAGFNVGQSYNENWENQKDATTIQLTNVKPFSHISYIGEFHIETVNDVDTEFIHKTAL